MNRIYKVIWSKVKNCYIVVSEIAKSHSKPVSKSSRQCVSAAAALAVLALLSVPVGVYAQDGVTTFVDPANKNIKMGNGISLRNNNGQNGTVAIGDHVQVDDYVMQQGSVAIGNNAFAENMWGVQERTFRFGMTENKDLMAGIAVGQNTYTRSGISIGDHKYVGRLGDISVDSTTDDGRRKLVKMMGATTLGHNSYSNGAFATTSGAYSIMTNAYGESNVLTSAAQNFGAVINGSFNSIESATASSMYSGIANSVVGTVNRSYNSNGTLIFGAGNEVTNSVENISVPLLGYTPSDAKDLADTLRSNIRGTDGNGTPGGAVLAIGGGNKADYAVRSQLSGVGNTLTGTSSNRASYNMLNGYRNKGTTTSYATMIGTLNTITNGTNNVVVGNKQKLTGASNNIVLGTADSEIETTVSDAVAIGHNAKTTATGGVALGTGAAASTALGQQGYDPSTKANSTSSTIAWKSTAGAVSVGDASSNITRQITGVAAGTNATDAVNVAQLMAVAGNSSGGSSVHFFSVNGDENQDNYNNDGATGTNAIAVGTGAKATENGAVAIGHIAQATGSTAIALGFNALAGGSSTVIGESSIVNAPNVGQGVGSIIIGSESADIAGDKAAGASNDTIIGGANRVKESNGVFVSGQGNIVDNAYKQETLTTEDQQKLVAQMFMGTPAGDVYEKMGSHVSVNGDGNYVKNATFSQISGTNNQIIGSDTTSADYNIVTGNRNVVENATNNIITGDNYNVTGANNNVILGSTDETKNITVSDTVSVGHNANATVADGVALGSNSVASVTSGVAGYDPTTKTASTATTPTWKSTLGAVSVGVPGTDAAATQTRQITGVAAGMQATDAVNVAQLTAVNTKVDANTTNITNLTNTVNSNKTKYYSVDDYDGRLASMGNADNSGAQGIASLVAGIGSKVEEKAGFQGATATVVGALNTVAAGTQAYDGVANSIVGVANATQNANATLIFGAGNAVTNSYADVDLDIGSINPADPVGTARTLGAAVGNSGGQVLVIGGANSVDYARFSAVTGVSNSLTGKDDNTSDYNFITGAKNTLTNADSTYVIGSKNTVSDGSSNIVVGDNRKLTGTTGNVVIGSADNETETTVSDATILGHNANATVADGVALGSNSVASVAKGVVGTVPTGTTVSDTDKASATWTSTLGAVSVGVPGTNAAATQTRQITGVAAGTQDTDAVNVAQLNAVNTVVNNHTTSISNLNTAVAANKIRFFSVTGNDTDGNVDNTAAIGFKSLAVGSSMLTEGHWAATVGVGGMTTSYSGNNFGTANFISNPYNSNKDIIPLAVIKGDEEYTYKRDENGKFTDMALWGGLATTIGSVNMIQPDYVAGVLPLDGFNNTLIGAYNSTENSNGAYLLGWNNKVTNSYFVDDEKLPDQFNPLFDVTTMNSESFGGAVVAIGMDNTVDGAQHSYIMGTANTVSGTVTDGTVEKVATNNVVIGDNHKVDNASHTVILGSADTETTTDQDGVVVVGHNANATTADGVALGSNSVASVAKGVVGAVPTGTTVSDTDKASATWTSTLGAVSVGVPGDNAAATQTRQITGVAAGTQDTDAVNVAQLNAVNANISNTVNANKVHFFHVNSTSGTNYDNNGAKGTDSIAIGKASTAADNSIAIGNGASVSDSNGGKGSGDIAIGNGAKINNYVDQSASIAIGQNAQIDNMTGMQEYIFSLGQTNYGVVFRPNGTVGFAPEDPSKVATGIAIGENTFVRTGGLMIGTHNYRGTLGDVDVDSAKIRQTGVNVNSTTLGTNSYNSGAFATIVGAYSIASGNYASGGGEANASKNLGATIVGSLNSVESSTAASTQSGMANSVVGVANRTFNSNGSLIFGAGNEITNSVVDISSIETSNITSAKDLQTNLIKGIKDSNSGGATLAIGGGNTADYTQHSALIGVNNTIEGSESAVSQYNALTGFNNTATGVTNVTVTGSNNTVSDSTSIVNLGNENAVSESNNTVLLGDNRTVTGSDNSIILGRANKETTTTLRAAADTTLTTTADNVVVLGYNANATVADGVALGSNSVASVDKGQLGYNPSSKELTDTAKSSATWTSTLGSVSVGDVDNDMTRQITGVAAGKNDTDAVNVAQLKANKVALEQGDNVTITSTVGDDGDTIYTIKSTDTNTTLASGTVTYVGADGTLKLTDSAGATVTVTGLKNTYLTGATLSGNTLTLTQNEGNPITVTGIATTADLASNKTHFYSVNSTDDKAGNYNNDGAKGANALAAGVGAVANTQNSIAIGNSAQILGNGGNSTGTSSIAIGDKATVTTNGLDLTSIAIGKNAVVLNGSGKQDRALSFTPDNYASDSDLPINADVSPGGIAIGTNAYARTASVQIGAHTMDGYVMGGTEITGTSQANLVGMTTIGSNSYNKGAMGSMLGAYSVMTGDFDSSGGFNSLLYGSQNFGANVVGSLNSIRSAGYTGASGVANSIVGVGNIAENANGALIYGAGNKITNSLQSISGIDTLTSNLTVDQMTDAIRKGIQSSGGGGSTLAVGGGNTADYTRNTAIIGVNNTVSGVSGNVSQYNFVSGYNNTSTGGDNATIIGTNRTLTGVDNTIVIGSADSTIETTANNAIAIGRNTNVTVDGGVALGQSSIADTDKGAVGYDMSGRITDADSILGNNTQYQTLQTEVADAQTTVNTLTSESATLQGYLDEIKSMYPSDYEQQEAYQGIKAQYDAKQSELADAQTDLSTKQSALAEIGKAVYTWQATAGAVSVGDVSKGITRQITDVAAGTADTDAVNVAQLKAAKVEVVAGTNISSVDADTTEGYTKYTVNAIDTKVTGGSATYDPDGTGTITLNTDTNGTAGTVTVSGLTDKYVDAVTFEDNTLTIKRNDDKTFTVENLATKDDITGDNSIVSMNFAGDTATDVVTTKNGGTLNVLGGAKEFTTADNIGVVKDSDNALKVKLAKELTMADGNINFNNGVKLSSAGLSNGGQKITNVAAGEADTDAVNVSQLNANKVTVVKGANTTVDSTKADDGSMTYTVNAIDTKVTGGSVAYDATTGAGTMTLTTSDEANPVKVTGLQDTYVTDVTLKDHTLTITQNAGNPFEVKNIATMDDISSVSGKHTAITLDGAAPEAGENGALGDYIGSNNLTMAVKDVNGQKVYDLKMSKDLVAGTKPGADGKDGEAGSVTIIGEPGKDGEDGTPGKNAVANITVKDGTNGLDGKDGLTRIVYADEDGTPHEVATLDDGLKFTGDTENVTVSKKLNETLSITGGITDEAKLSDNNIGVVAKADGGLTVKLAKDLTMADGSISFNNGVKLSSAGLDNGNQKITNVAAGTADTDAVNVSQLTKAITGVSGAHTAITLDGTAPEAGENGALGKYIGSNNLTMAVKDVNGQKVYDLKMSKDLVAGTPGKAGEDGQPGTPGTPGSITIIGEPGKDGADGTNTSANITVKDGKNGLDGKDGLTRIVYKDEGGEDHEIATLDDGLNFTGDTAGVTVSKKLNETLSITGGITDADELTTVDNIGVVASDSGLKVRLAKDLQDLNSVRIGGKAAGEGIYIAKQSINNTNGTAEEGNYVTGLTNTTWNPKADGYVSGRAATEDQLNSVYETINSNIESSKAVSGKNITVDENNKVNLNDNITLGGDTAANQVNINGNEAKVTAGDGANKVVVDGTNGQVTIGEAGKGVVLGNQTNVEGTKSDGTKDSQSGKYLTGLDNTTWDPANKGIVENRAATEGQLKDIADQISDIDTAVKSSSRVFESDSGADAQVTRKNTDPMKLKGGADADNLSDNNIGVVNNSDGTGFDIKLSKDIKGLNSIEVNNKITIGTGDHQTVIEGDTINTGSVTTGNTTINNDGLTIVNEDSSKNITINNNNVNMGGNVIKNIGEGTEPTDAINKTQFDRAINNIGTGMNQINNRVNKLDTRINRVGAGAAALAALHPLEFSPEAKWEVTAGVGNYRGANAIALGAFYRPNFDTMFSIGTSYGGGENMINAGVTWRIGEGETKVYPSKTVMAQEIDDLKSVVSEQQDQIEELKKLVNSLINK